MPYVDCDTEMQRPYGFSIFNQISRSLTIWRFTEDQFMAVSKFLNYKFIVVNIKMPGFENPQVGKAISLPIRKTHPFIR